VVVRADRAEGVAVCDVSSVQSGAGCPGGVDVSHIMPRGEAALRQAQPSPGMSEPWEPATATHGQPPTLLVAVRDHGDGRETAATSWAGDNYSATSRNGAILALCRKLVAAGCPDLPWTNGRGLSGWVHGAALMTVAGGDQPLRFVKWKPGPFSPE
jgi:hypothetical protein